LLTPLDIHNKEFGKSIRGYNTDEVDGFLDEVIKDFEVLYKENLDLKEKMQKQEENINQYKEIEQALQNTLVLAQKISDEVKQNAQKEAELHIWEARKKGEQIVAQAEEEITEAVRRVEKLRGLERQIFVRIRSFLMAHMDMVDNYDNAEDVESDIYNEVAKEMQKQVESDSAALVQAVENEERKDEEQIVAEDPVNEEKPAEVNTSEAKGKGEKGIKNKLKLGSGKM
jgi:cell division initiation protein